VHCHERADSVSADLPIFLFGISVRQRSHLVRGEVLCHAWPIAELNRPTSPRSEGHIDSESRSQHPPWLWLLTVVFIEKYQKRRKPDPQGRPGYLRVDTVYQGDGESAKGVYHINAIDVRIAVETLLELSNLRIQREGLKWRSHLLFRGLTALPVKFDAG
jgi:hypothetical protein